MRVFQRNGQWWIDYTYQDESGFPRRKREKVGPNRRMAELALAKCQTKILEGRFLDQRRFRPIPFSNFAVIFDEKYLRLKPAYQTHKCRLKRMIDFFRNRQLSSISSFDISRFKVLILSQKTLRKTNTKPATFNRYVTLLKVMFNMAVEWGFLPSNPIKGVTKEKEPLKEIRALTPAEKYSLLQAAMVDTAEIYALITIALNTGLRTGDIMKFRMDAVQLSNKRLDISMGKTGKVLNVPLNDGVIEAIKALDKNEGELLFPPRRVRIVAETKGEPRRDFRRAWERVKREAGIRNLRFYDLRHTFATDLMKAGVHLRVVQELLGHTTPLMTQRYAHVQDVDKKLAVEKLQELNKLHHESPVIEKTQSSACS